MRRSLVLGGMLAFSFALLHCVGDAPSSDSDAGGTGTDGGVTEAAASDSSSGDAGPSDSGSVLPNDAGPGEDLCIGHADCPGNVQVGDLQLWLRGNIGASCVGGRVAVWSDQSGKGHDAHPGTHQNGTSATAPQCGGSHIAAHDVVTFTAPSEPDGGDAGEYTQYVDETLGLDLHFVAGSNYTFFVVHRRSVDGAFGLIGQDRSVNPGIQLSCITFMGNIGPQDALFFGYQPLASTGDSLAFNHGCFGSQAPSDTYVASHTDVDEVVFASTVGHQLYSNGALVLDSETQNDHTPISDSGASGVIGRGFNRFSVDSRYRGDIAEIIGYSRALSDPERAELEGYLKRQWQLSF